MGKLPSEILDAAADLITPEGAWTRKELARDKTGAYADPLSDKAVAWCIKGAIMRAGWAYYGLAIDACADFLGMSFEYGGPLQIWNDDPTRTQSEVIEALRTAAARAREAGQ